MQKLDRFVPRDDAGLVVMSRRARRALRFCFFLVKVYSRTSFSDMEGDAVTKFQAGIIIATTTVALLINFFACALVFSEVRNVLVFWFTVTGNLMLLVVISALVSKLLTGGFFK